jgi:predicted phosphodiesterase
MNQLQTLHHYFTSATIATGNYTTTGLTLSDTEIGNSLSPEPTSFLGIKEKQGDNMRRKYERWLVLPDIHIPYEDKRTMEALESYIKDVQKSNNPFVGWLQLGDLLDLDEISRWNAGYEASIKGSLAESFERGNSFLDRHRELMGENCKMVLLQGNHDYRTVDFGRKYPHMREFMDYERNLRLESRKIQYVKCWEKGEFYRLGNSFLTHGLFINQYHAAKSVLSIGASVFYGHTHDVQEFSIVQMGNDKTLVGKSLGCLCLYEQSYLNGKATKWQHAFTEFCVFPNGMFQENTIKIFNHRFVGLNGKVYQG